MWGEEAPRRIFAFTQPTDMRKSFQGLLAVVQRVFTEDPYSGNLFVFVNRRRDHVKILAWDRTGFALYAKRLERGRFRLPSSSDHQEPSEQALRFLLDGIPLGMNRISV